MPPVNRTLLSGGASVDSGRPLPGSMLYNPEGSVIDVSSGTCGSVVTFLPQEVMMNDVYFEIVYTINTKLTLN